MAEASISEPIPVEADERVEIGFRLNGESVRTQVLPRQHLADLLRQEFQLTGVHLGCEHGICGACNVVVDGHAVRGCLMLAIQADGADVLTIEGLTASGAISALQEAFVRRNALQCGFCTSGILVSAYALLQDDDMPDRGRIREAISGNICRCTGYHAIIDAVETAARARQIGGDVS